MANMFPAWLLPEPGRYDAVKRRVPLALKELRRLYTASGRDPTKCIGREGKFIHVALLEQVLRNPAAHWARHVRENSTGEQRWCYTPSKELALLQNNLAMAIFWSALHVPFTGIVKPLFPATAYGYQCSIVENAKFHRRNRSSFRVDLKHAFPSVTANHIAAYLVRNGIGKHLAWVAARVFTFRGRIEQGASIAPSLFNIMLRQFDEALIAAVGTDVVYTRYGDDCCFSHPSDAFPKELEATIADVIEARGFRINAKKTRRAKNGCVDLPGVYIKNGRIRPPKAYIRKLQELVANGTLSIGFKSEAEAKVATRKRNGHIAFIAQFEHGGRLRVFREGIGGLRFDTGRTRNERQRRAEHDKHIREESERANRAANGIPEPEQYF